MGQSSLVLVLMPGSSFSYSINVHVETTCLMKCIAMWKMHGRLSDTYTDRMVIDREIYSGKNNAIGNFQFVMAIRTGQYTLFAIISFIIILCFIKLFNVCRYIQGLLASQSWTCLFNCCHWTCLF